ncbi:hypothetical protein [Kitasatospora sp. NPDC002040]|uniref:hypothetical protein n=1 Tax=Kitasatospora sp. NPDC002040 TaxID=3154661 RepID=UPI00332AAEB3
MPRNLPLLRPIDRREPYEPYLVVTGDRLTPVPDPVAPTANGPVQQSALTRTLKARKTPDPVAPAGGAAPGDEEPVRIMDGVGGMFGPSPRDPSPWRATCGPVRGRR